MRIAQVAPLYESVPPKLYGGTERVVSFLTEELIRQGHDVTLFASGDSLTKARLVPVCKQSLRLDPGCVDPLAHHVVLVERALEERENFDLIHFHIDYLHFPRTQNLDVVTLTTLHGRLDIPDLAPVYQRFRDVPVVSISDAQRGPLPWLNWQGTVYHGLPSASLKFQPEQGKYLAFLGRTSPEKGLEQAIAIARHAGIELKIAAKIDRVDQAYFDFVIKPLLDGPWVEFVGEITDFQKSEFLGGALALLTPVQWPEPFGLVMIEAMACGTPVIAYPRGSVQEIVKNGVSGFVVSNVQEAVEAIRAIQSLSRRHCRAYFERHFSASRMANDYLSIYNRQLELSQQPVVSQPEDVANKTFAGLYTTRL